jgi:SAM-dependent methyltransferase
MPKMKDAIFTRLSSWIKSFWGINHTSTHQSEPTPRNLPYHVSGIHGRIHPFDFMINSSTEEGIIAYNRIGNQVLDLCREAVEQTGQDFSAVSSILDYGCGYGRVTRKFVEVFPAGKIDVFDVDPGGPKFCAEEFGVNPIYFHGDWSSVSFRKYSVIWVGSVFTHLDEQHTRRFLKLLIDLLTPEGILVFTTQGENALDRLKTGFYGERFQVNAPTIDASFSQRGFGFFPYEQVDLQILPIKFEGEHFGMTWMSQTYVNSLVEEISGETLTSLYFKPAGWDWHQDVYAYQLTKST